MKLIFFDLETTGLDPSKHEVMQVAAIAVDEDLHIVEEFEVKVRVSGRCIPKGVLHLTRYDSERWKREAVSPRLAALRLAQFFKKHATRTTSGPRGPRRVAQLVAHHAAFDGPFLEAWSRRLHVRMPVAFRVLCTLQRAEWFFAESSERRPESMKLLSLCEHLDVAFSELEAHDALADARATLGLYAELIGRSRVIPRAA